MDGVDAAQIVTDGRRVLERGPTAYRPYSDSERAVLRAAQGRWPDDDVAEAARVVHLAHEDVLGRFSGADLIGFHGQTVAHDPSGRGTHQVADGSALAQRMGVPVVWDFRSADVALGGQGAPLASFYHFALAQESGAKEAVGFLNMGGVGNLTWVNPTASGPEVKGALLAFDTGPANAPMDDLMQARRGLARDEGGSIAATGVVNEAIVAAYLDAAYFYMTPPKSLDRSDFGELLTAVADLSDADALATLAAASAAAVGRGLTHCPRPPTQVLVTGGGRHNAALMRALTDRLPCPVAPVEEMGFDGDMIEAEAFAFLAARVRAGLPTSAPGTTGVPVATGGGQVSRPDGAK